MDRGNKGCLWATGRAKDALLLTRPYVTSNIDLNSDYNGAENYASFGVHTPRLATCAFSATE
jgi:hypothetical protein